MSWRVVPAWHAAQANAVVSVVDVPVLPEQIDYSEILGRSLTSPTGLDRLASGLLVVIATKEGAEEMKQLGETHLIVPVRTALTRLEQRGQIVALRWMP